METLNDTKSSKTLLQLYTPVFALVSALEAKDDYGDPEELAVKTIRLLNFVRETSQISNKSMDWVGDAQYAVVAFVDESINLSKWHGREKWRQYPLASRLGLQPNMGVAFFDKLEAWLKSPRRPIELLEVFYVCLGLGFSGQYFNQRDTLARIKRDLLHELTSRDNPPGKLSPNAARKPDERLDFESENFPWMWLASFAIGLLLVLFFVFERLSSGEIEKLVKQLGG